VRQLLVSINVRSHLCVVWCVAVGKEAQSREGMVLGLFVGSPSSSRVCRRCNQRVALYQECVWTECQLKYLLCLSVAHTVVNG
jgi:hypothetical protein